MSLQIWANGGESDNFTPGPNFADLVACILAAKHYKSDDLIEARNNIKSPSPISKARPKSSTISSMSHPGLVKSTTIPFVMYDRLNNLVPFSNACAEYDQVSRWGSLTNYSALPARYVLKESYQMTKVGEVCCLEFRTSLLSICRSRARLMTSFCPCGDMHAVQMKAWQVAKE